jgi:hypothetical protein
MTALLLILQLVAATFATMGFLAWALRPAARMIRPHE